MAWSLRPVRRRLAPAASSRHPSARVAAVLVAAAGIGLGACGGSGALPLSASEHLSRTIPGPPGSAQWCTGLDKTAESMTGLGRGESLGIAARIVDNDEHRVRSALHGLPRRSGAAAALREAARTAEKAVSDLRDGRNAGLIGADRASSEVDLALTRFHAPSGAGC